MRLWMAGDGVISFPTRHRAMGPSHHRQVDLSEYKGQIAADHDIDQLRHREARGLAKLSAKVR